MAVHKSGSAFADTGDSPKTRTIECAAREEKAAEYSRRLVEWFDPRRRSFRWRHSTDLYFVTICEILLQRTNAEKVSNVVSALFRRFPTPSDLASADMTEIKGILEPLGLPRRAHYVKEVAAAFAAAAESGCEFDPERLPSLPGIGPYVSAAAKVLALGVPDAIIDEHVLRVLSRVFSVQAPARRHPTKRLRQFARSLVPQSDPKAYNLAILDLGRLICRPRSPRCADCPLTTVCDYASGRGDEHASTPQER